MKKKIVITLLVLLITLSCMGIASCTTDPPPSTLRFITVKEGTLKTAYMVGETISLDGAKISKTMTDNSVTEESITGSMVSGFSTESSGTRAMLITYQGLVAAVDYTVAAAETANVNSIAVKAGSLTSAHLLNATLSLDNAKLIVQLSDGTTSEVDISADMVMGYDSSKKGDGTLYISYQGKVCLFNYSIIELVTLNTPEIKLNGNVISWTKQNFVEGYEIYLDSRLVATVTDSFYNIEKTEIGNYVYSVKAKGNGASVLDSAVSASVEYSISLQSVSAIELDKDGFHWAECIGATGYTVNIDGVEHIVSEPRYNMTFDETITYAVSIKVNYAQESSAKSKTFAFHALKSPSNLTITENLSNKQFTFSWEREFCNIDTGYTLYYRSGDKITAIASAITNQTYTASFSAFKDRQIDGIYVAATDSRADCIAIGQSEEVQLPSQITTMDRPTGLSLDGGYVFWDEAVAGVRDYSISGVGTSITTTSKRFDTVTLNDGNSYTLSVMAKSNSDYCFDSPSVSYNFYKHASPSNLKMQGNVLHFSGNAKSLLYEVTFQYKTYIATNFSLDLSEQIAALGAGTHAISVRALPSGFITNEVPSSAQSVTITVYTMKFAPGNNTLSWDAIVGATGYRVRIDDGELTDIGNKTSVAITTDTTAVEVIPYSSYGDLPIVGNIANLIVLSYDAKGGSPAPAPVSRLVGGTIGQLPSVSYGTAKADWYDSTDVQTRKLVTSTDILMQDTTIYAGYDIVKYDTSGAQAIVTGLHFTPNEAFSIVIPVTKDGKPVTSIANNAFKDKANLTSIEIPDSVTSIGDYAFYGCTGITGITIPDKVTSIGDYAFCGCTSLASITIPSGVTGIGNSAFRGCTSLASITIPSSVTTIGNSAFYDCAKLAIYAEATGKQSGWHSNWNPNNRPVVWDCVGFGETAELKYRYNNAGEISIAGYIGSPTTIDIPSSIDGKIVKYIGDSAFYDCRSLASITIPSSVTSIGNSAFYKCRSLASITIHSGVTSIGEYAFYDCSEIIIYAEATEPSSEWDSKWNFSNRPVVWNCKDNDEADDGIIYYVADNGLRFSLKDTIATLRKQSASLSGEIEIPSTVIYKDATYNVTTINSSVFSGCTSLESITIPSSVTSIGYSAFSGCRNLISIIIPSSVASIGDRVFSNCSRLTIYVEAKEKPYEWGNGWASISQAPASYCLVVWDCKTNDEVYYVDSNGLRFSLKDTIATLTMQSYLLSGAIEIPQTITYKSTIYNVTTIGSSAFFKCERLTSITIPDSVTSIGAKAFYDCTSLVSIIIPSSVTTIGYSAFQNCTSLASITIPSSVTSIGEYAFDGCAKLTIYAEATGEQSGWGSSWNSSNRPVVWGHKVA